MNTAPRPTCVQYEFSESRGPRIDSGRDCESSRSACMAQQLMKLPFEHKQMLVSLLAQLRRFLGWRTTSNVAHRTKRFRRRASPPHSLAQVLPSSSQPE
jgi:hypothetical protein